MAEDVSKIEVGAGPSEGLNVDQGGSDDAALRSFMKQRKGEAPDQGKPEPKPSEQGDTKPAAPAKDGQKPEKPQGKAQQAIGKLTRHVSDLKAERDELRARIEALQAKPAPEQKDFASEREFDRAVTRHETELTFEQKALQQESARIEAKTREEWDSRVAEQVKDKERFAAAYPEAYKRLSNDPEVRKIVAQSHFAPAIIEALIENVYDNGPREQKWMRMSPYARAQEVIKFEQALALAPDHDEPESEPQVSKAPKAPSIEGKPVGSASPKNDDDAMKNYMRNRRNR